MKQAYQSKFYDIEDAIQYYIAIKEGLIDFFQQKKYREF